MLESEMFAGDIDGVSELEALVRGEDQCVIDSVS